MLRMLVRCLSLLLMATCASSSRIWGAKSFCWKIAMRGGADTTQNQSNGLTLDEKVQAAMKKLGLKPPREESTSAGDASCEGGVCPMPDATTSAPAPGPAQDANQIAARIAKDLQVDVALAMAAIGATAKMEGELERRFDEQAARDMIQQELEFIGKVSADEDEVKQLVSEGHDVFLTRRALAFAEMNMDDARAILLADEMDAEEEEQETAPLPHVDPPPLKTIRVNADFDPMAGIAAPAHQVPSPQQQIPKQARKEDVVFEATAADVQKLVLESPVPVLLDIYADWCGPCKTLGPILEEMAIKGGGMFRLVKINSDNERAISGALEVTALPTVFGIRDGRILHMFQGMPRGEEGMKNFMMGLLMPGASFDPPVTAAEAKKYTDLSSKLAKTAGGAGFSFSARERLHDRTVTRLDELVELRDGDMADAEESAGVVRSLLSNVIRDPFEAKYRRVNLENKVLAARVAAYPPCISILKSVGFVMESGRSAMTLGKSKKVVNVAPLAVARDCIDKWIDKNRQQIATAKRRHHDEVARKRLAEERADAGEDEEDEEEDEEEVDPDAVSIKVRLDGKKTVHELFLRVDDPLSLIVDSLPVQLTEDDEVQLTCVAKRLVVKSSDEAAMGKSLRDHGLVPTASIVVKIGDGSQTENSSKLKERAAVKKSRKKGSHTMQSVGIYGKDDNAKGELIDGGGGVLYEQDVTDDEDAPAADEPAEGNDDDQEEEQNVPDED